MFLAGNIIKAFLVKI